MSIRNKLLFVGVITTAAFIVLLTLMLFFQSQVGDLHRANELKESAHNGLLQMRNTVIKFTV
ncbi:MAG: hypothetical protein ACQEQZ_00980 [Pseudomonadota bacterium]